MPSTFVAFALGISEQSFITNPAYNKTFDCEKIKAAIGVEYVLIVSKRFHDLNDSLSEVYQRYLQAEESSSQPVALVQNHPSVTFFQSSADKITHFLKKHRNHRILSENCFVTSSEYTSFIFSAAKEVKRVHVRTVNALGYDHQ